MNHYRPQIKGMLAYAAYEDRTSLEGRPTLIAEHWNIHEDWDNIEFDDDSIIDDDDIDFNMLTEI